MKKLLLPILSIFLFSSFLQAQYPGSAKILTVQSGKKVYVDGNLSSGKTVDLDFADRSTVACFPGTQNTLFRGNHVFYTFHLPAYSKVTISLQSRNEMSLYAYQLSKANYVLPPSLQSCLACEASHKERNSYNQAEKVMLNSIRNSYEVVVAVAGASGVTSGDFKLTIDMETTENPDAMINDNRPAKLYSVQVPAGTSKSFKGNLSEGKEIPLRWASYSSMACFPATQNEHFRGRHVFYGMDMPAYSKINVTLTGDANINLYGIQGWDGKKLPPDISSCVSCEASHTNRSGQTISFNSIHNPYGLLIGVAGAKGKMDGNYTLKIEVIDLTPEDHKVDDNRPAKLYTIEVPAGSSKSFSGNISEGKEIPLRWASYSSMACFPGTQNEHFRGRHLFYGLNMPAYSKVNVTLTGDRNINLYGIQGWDGKKLPPDISSCVSCEASHTNRSGQTISFNSIHNPYGLLIGVAGAKGMMEGSFSLKIEIIDLTPEDHKIKDEKEPKLYLIEAVKGKAMMWKGNINVGKQIPLGWAESGQVACFPGTQFEHYRGNHVFYTLELPRYSKMTIMLKSKKDINLYAMTSYNDGALPPNISRANCEATYTTRDGYKKVELMAINNPYKVLIGIAGARDVLDGDYELIIDLQAR